MKKGVWSPEEDTRLRLAVGLYGNSWVDVATIMPGRSNEQCRDRWSERLNPNVAKGKWTEEEDNKLLAVIESLTSSDNFSWKQVSDELATGRTDNMVNCCHCDISPADNLASVVTGMRFLRNVPRKRRKVVHQKAQISITQVVVVPAFSLTMSDKMHLVWCDIFVRG